MTREEATKQYWKWSQHHRSLPKDDQDSFLTFVVLPAVKNSKSQVQREILSRLLQSPYIEISAT